MENLEFEKKQNEENAEILSGDRINDLWGDDIAKIIDENPDIKATSETIIVPLKKPITYLRNGNKRTITEIELYEVDVKKMKATDGFKEEQRVAMLASLLSACTNHKVPVNVIEKVKGVDFARISEIAKSFLPGFLGT